MQEYQYHMDLSEEISVGGVLQRAQFEEAAEKLFVQMMAPIKEALHESALKVSDLEAVEMVRSTRVP